MEEKLDIFQMYLAAGYTIAKQDGLWQLFAPSGDGVHEAESVRELVMKIPRYRNMNQAISSFAESAMKVANALYLEKI